MPPIEPYLKHALRLFSSVIWALALAPSLAGAATLLVNSNGDDPDENPGDGSCFTGTVIVSGGLFANECTLRAALMEANSLAGEETITFWSGLPTVAGIVEISPNSVLPSIVSPVILDGYSAAGYELANPSAKPIINIGGAALSGTESGLVFMPGSDGSQVRGFAIHDFPLHGIHVPRRFSEPEPRNLVIEGCHLGVWRGVFYRGNAGHGIFAVDSDDLSIGLRCNERGCTGRRNVISGHGGIGIAVRTSERVSIQGNLIGTDVFGSSLFVSFGGLTQNENLGIWLDRGSQHQIGSRDQPEGGNLISGNGYGGMLIQANSSSVFGNRVGTNLNGTAALPNGGTGMILEGVGNVIGDFGPIAGNLISGNHGLGLVVGGGSTIRGNTIGLSADHTATIGNDSHGIILNGIGSRVERNTIAGSDGSEELHGIEAHGSRHTIVDNTIGTNIPADDLYNIGKGIYVLGDHMQIGDVGLGNTISSFFSAIGLRSGRITR